PCPRPSRWGREEEGGPGGASGRRGAPRRTGGVGGRRHAPTTRHYFETRPRIAEMDKLRVNMQVLSLCPPMVYWADSRLGTRLSRAFNDELAAALAERPDRLAGLATVPLQDVAESIAELERAMEGLGLRGVSIGSNVNGKDLDHPDLLPFFARAEALRALVFI